MSDDGREEASPASCALFVLGSMVTVPLTIAWLVGACGMRQTVLERQSTADGALVARYVELLGGEVVVFVDRATGWGLRSLSTIELGRADWTPEQRAGLELLRWDGRALHAYDPRVGAVVLLGRFP